MQADPRGSRNTPERSGARFRGSGIRVGASAREGARLLDMLHDKDSAREEG